MKTLIAFVVAFALTCVVAFANVGDPPRSYQVFVPVKVVSSDKRLSITPDVKVPAYIQWHCLEYEGKQINIFGPWAGNHIRAIEYEYEHGKLVTMIVRFHC